MKDVERVKRLLGSYNHDPEHAELYQALAGVIADAERYRWLRQHHADALLPLAWAHGPAACAIGGDTDAAIDAAMAGANSQDNPRPEGASD